MIRHSLSTRKDLFARTDKVVNVSDTLRKSHLWTFKDETGLNSCNSMLQDIFAKKLGAIKASTPYFENLLKIANLLNVEEVLTTSMENESPGEF